jgi:hypothetical protein
MAAVPLVVLAFMAVRRKTAAGELLEDDDAQARAEQELARPTYEAKWRAEDKERSRQRTSP